MLTATTSQYLHHEYLQPLPTTLDAKKSPLALLAQTCSNIGKDTAPTKPLIPPIEKKDGRTSAEKANEKRSTPSEKKDSKTPSSRSDQPKETTSLQSRSPTSEKYSPNTSPKSHTPVTAHTPVSSHSPVPSSVSHSHVSRESGGSPLDVKHMDSKTYSSDSRTGLSSQPTQPVPGATLKPTPVSGTTGFTSHHPGLDPHLLGHPFSLDPNSIHSANAAYTSALAAHANFAMKSGDLSALSGNSSVSPYVAYAQVKTGTGATTLVPICRDPYCTNCQLTMRSAQLSGTCAAGCTQCNHEKTLAASSSLGLPGSGLTVPVLPVPGGNPLSGANGLSSLYSHSLMAAHHGLPYVCNWMSGTDHCGKRFSTSEELLQHLRTHTSSTELSTSLSLASVLPSYSMALPSASAASTLGSHYSHGSLSPNTLHRNYPTSLSPISSALAANRYHPYAKTGLASLSAGPSVPPIPFPTMGPYYSPYALYGQRLGAAVTP